MQNLETLYNILIPLIGQLYSSSYCLFEENQLRNYDSVISNIDGLICYAFLFSIHIAVNCHAIWILFVVSEQLKPIIY